MKTEKRANRNLNLLMNNIWGILKSFASILPFKFKLLHSSVIKAELWSTGTLHCKLKNDTSEPLFTVVENILLNHSNLGTTEGWNTLKYSLNRWPSLEVHHCNQCIEQQSQDSKQLVIFIVVENICSGWVKVFCSQLLAETKPPLSTYSLPHSS